MLNIVKLPAEDRESLIQIVAQEMGLPAAIVEKDLWVCYLLDYLFHRSEFRDGIVFKGGTSLSKAYGLIERFSEDIDLILDWRLIGYKLNEPWKDRSNSGQERFKASTIERTNDYLANIFAPSVKKGLSEELGVEADVRMADAEETVLFAYPKLFSSEATLDVVKLEIGPLAAWLCWRDWPMNVGENGCFYGSANSLVVGGNKTPLLVSALAVGVGKGGVERSLDASNKLTLAILVALRISANSLSKRVHPL